MMNYFWKIDDGRIWSFDAAGWVDPEDIGPGRQVINLYHDDQLAGVDYLIDCIKFYGGELGELATIEDKKPGDDYALVDGEWWKVRFTKKEFLLWCGVPQIAKLNTVRRDNAMAETVYTLLMAAEYIDVTDPATAQMVELLTTLLPLEMTEPVLTVEDAARILQGEKYDDGTEPDEAA